jgi:hypothetical protein
MLNNKISTEIEGRACVHRAEYRSGFEKYPWMFFKTPMEALVEILQQHKLLQEKLGVSPLRSIGSGESFIVLIINQKPHEVWFNGGEPYVATSFCGEFYLKDRSWEDLSNATETNKADKIGLIDFRILEDLGFV